MQSGWPMDADRVNTDAGIKVGHNLEGTVELVIFTRGPAMIRFVMFAIVLSATGMLLAGAEQPPVKNEDKKDPQASVEPKSKPGAGQKYLEKFVGDWEVAKTFHPRVGEPIKQKGECHQTMIHGGRFLQSEFTFEADGGKTTGTGTIGFEPETGKFTSVWIDSRQTRMSFRQAEGKFDGEQIVLFSKELESKEGRRSKTITKMVDEGKKIVHRQFSIAQDNTERLMMELVLTKK